MPSKVIEKKSSAGQTRSAVERHAYALSAAEEAAQRREAAAKQVQAAERALAGLETREAASAAQVQAAKALVVRLEGERSHATAGLLIDRGTSAEAAASAHLDDVEQLLSEARAALDAAQAADIDLQVAVHAEREQLQAAHGEASSAHQQASGLSAALASHVLDAEIAAGVETAAAIRSDYDALRAQIDEGRRMVDAGYAAIQALDLAAAERLQPYQLAQAQARCSHRRMCRIPCRVAQSCVASRSPHARTTTSPRCSATLGA